MQEILVRAGSFVVIIAFGFIFRRLGLFGENDFKLISKIILKVTFPAVIVANFAGKPIDLAMLPLAAMGLGFGILCMAIAFLRNIRTSKETSAFEIMNLSGYNIGNFTLPFVQSFVGPTGIVVTSLFDTGNALVCMGGSYGIAGVVKDGTGFSFKKIGASLIRSVPFDCYIIMLVLNLLKLNLPGPIVSLAQVGANANPFLVMLMIGIGMKLGGDKKQYGYIAKFLLFRYSISTVLALVVYFLLPMPLETRTVVVFMLFSPVPSAIPAFTNDLGCDVGLSSTINSLSIICSIVILTVLLVVMVG